MTKKIDELKNDIVKTLQKKLWGWFLVGLAVLGGVTGLSLWGIKCKTEQIVINRITKQFEEPKIQEILKSVAESKAKEIIENRLNPEIENAKLTVNQKINSFEEDLTQFKEKYDIELTKLAKEIEYIKNRNEIFKLSDLAISTGDAEPFGKLESIYDTSSDEDIKMSALAGIYQVKEHFATMTRTKGIIIKYPVPYANKVFEEDEIPTEALLEGLKNTKIWQYRARAMEILKYRKEKTVPEALLNTIKNDSNLEVRKKAMDSFQTITGYKSSDVFKYDPAVEWWQQNKSDVESKLKDLQTIKMALEENKK